MLDSHRKIMYICPGTYLNITIIISYRVYKMYYILSNDKISLSIYVQL